MSKRNSSVDSKLVRPFSYPKKSLPPISGKAREYSQQGQRLTPHNMSTDFALHAYPNDKSQTLNGKEFTNKFFKNLHRESESVSPKCKTAHGISRSIVASSNEEELNTEVFNQSRISFAKQVK